MIDPRSALLFTLSCLGIACSAQAPFAIAFNDPADPLPIGTPDLTTCPNGDLIACAPLPYTAAYIDTARLMFIRIDPDGGLVNDWTILAEGINITGLHVLPLADGGCVAMGRESTRPFFLRCAADGTPTVARTYQAAGTAGFTAWSMAYLPDSTLIAASWYEVVRLTTNGEVIWWKHVGLPGGFAPGFWDVLHAGPSGIALLGSMGGAYPWFHTTVTSLDLDGTINWCRSFVQEDLPGDLICYGGMQLPNGDLRIGGKYHAVGGDHFDPVLLALSGAGDPQWGRLYPPDPADTIGYDLQDARSVGDTLLYLSDGGGYGHVLALDATGAVAAQGVMPLGVLHGAATPTHGYYALSSTITSNGPGVLLMHPDAQLRLCREPEEGMASIPFTPSVHPGWSDQSLSPVGIDRLPLLSMTHPALDATVLCQEVPTTVPSTADAPVQLFPVPARETLTLQGTTTERFQVLDALGRTLVDERPTRTQDPVIQVGHLTPGHYLVRWRTLEGWRSRRFIKVE